MQSDPPSRELGSKRENTGEHANYDYVAEEQGHVDIRTLVVLPTRNSRRESPDVDQI